MLTNGYVKLYRKVLDHPVFTQLPATVLKVWIYCIARANLGPTQWYDGHQQIDIPAGAFIFSQESLAKDCHLSRRQIRTALQHLQNLQCVAIRTTNRYSLLVVVKYSLYQLTGPTSGPQAAIGGPTEGQQAATEEEYKKKRSKEENTCASEPDARQVDLIPLSPKPPNPQIAWFDSWWDAYWLKKAKKNAWRAFQKLVKTEDQFETIMVALKAQTPEMLCRDPDKRPYPATWLNGERWQDQTKNQAVVIQPKRQDLSTKTLDTMARNLQKYGRIS